MANLLITDNASYLNELLMYCKLEIGLRLSNIITLLTNLHEGQNLKVCLYIIGKGNSKFSLSN
jgi:hypothetical protein